MKEHNHLQAEEPINEAEYSASRGGQKKDMFLPISILAAAIMVGGAIVFSTLYKGGSPAAPIAGNVNAAASTTVNAAQAMTLGPRDAILGDASAKVTLIEYGDYQCPYCVQFFSQTESKIIQNYVNTGKVRMVFRDFAFLGPESIAASEAAQCAQDQNKLWAYHDALYTAKMGDDTKGGTEDDGFYNRAEFLKLAQQVGLNIPTFTSCIDNNTDASVVSGEKGAATGVGVTATPSFIINGQMVSGAQPYSVFQQTLDAALK